MACSRRRDKSAVENETKQQPSGPLYYQGHPASRLDSPESQFRKVNVVAKSLGNILTCKLFKHSKNMAIRV